MAYKRVLLKLSGEQLSGEFDAGIDPKIADLIAEEIKKASHAGTQFVVVIGGGNLVRGAKVAGHGIKRVTADHMGMLSGVINAIAITDIFEAHGITTRCLSNIFADQVAEAYSYRRADKHLEQGRLVVVAGGMGRPYFTHDVAAVNLALELGCEVVLKSTKVDGIYNKDPNQHDEAYRLEVLSFQEAVENPDITVMDKAALGLAMEQNKQIIVFDLFGADNLARIINGENIGTKVG